VLHLNIHVLHDDSCNQQPKMEPIGVAVHIILLPISVIAHTKVHACAAPLCHLVSLHAVMHASACRCMHQQPWRSMIAQDPLYIHKTSVCGSRLLACLSQLRAPSAVSSAASGSGLSAAPGSGPMGTGTHCGCWNQVKAAVHSIQAAAVLQNAHQPVSGCCTAALTALLPTRRPSWGCSRRWPLGCRVRRQG
jgi:hypothetical protein